MRSKDESKFKEIADAIMKFMIDLGRTPSQRELAEAVNMTKSSIANYIKAMHESGLIVKQSSL